MKSVLLVVLAYIVLSTTPQLTAQRPDREEHREDVRELRADLRSWFDSNVKATLLEWKREYDASLSAEDLAELNALRDEAKKRLRRHIERKDDVGRPDGRKREGERRADRKRGDTTRSDGTSTDRKRGDTTRGDGTSTDRKRGDTTRSDGTSTDRKRGDTTRGDGVRDADARRRAARRDSMRNAREEFFDRLRPIAERSKDKLKSIFEEGQDEIKSWKAEAREIIENWREEHPDAKRGFHYAEGMGPLALGHGRRAAIRFMLWDGTLPEESELGFQANPTGLNDATSVLSSPLRVAPLPAENTVVLSMQELPNGPATIEIFTMDGVLVRSMPVNISGNVLDERIDVSALNAGTYMASVNTPTGRRTSPILVNR